MPIRAKNAPRPGTFGEFVCSYPPDVRPQTIAKDARASGKWPNATAQAVSNARYHYRVLPQRQPLPPSGAASTRAASVSVARRAATRGGESVPSEVSAMIARYGTDCVRRALMHAEARVTNLLDVNEGA